jgi:cyclopropane fatty-acyl-phospholipid synthase-like methyltransferase
MNKITMKTFRSQLSSLNKKWRKISPKQKIYQAPNKRLANAMENFDFLKGCNVLDIGCNQGLHSLMLSNISNSVIGLEGNENTYKRALCTQKHFSSLGYNSSNVTFVNSPLKDFNDYEGVNAILACCCIYNMNDENIDNFIAILKQCHKLIYQTRPAANSRIKDRSRHDLCLEKDVIKFLEAEDFTIVEHKHSNSKWPIFCAERK